MGLESATYISQLTATNPTASDPVSQGDDHLRLIKSVLQSQFTTLGAAAVTTTAAELNLLDGVTSLTYTAGDGLDLTGQAFSTDLMSNVGLEIQSTELSVAQGISQYDVPQFAASVADNDFLKIDSTSVEGRSAAEVLSDIAALPLAGGTMSGEIAAADQVISRPEIKDYSETKVALSAAASVAIDLTGGNVFTITPDQNTTFTFTNPSPDTKSCAFTLIWTQDGSDRTISWPASVDWAGGSAPDVTSGSAKRDVYTFFTLDAGVIWYGFQAGADMS